MFQRLRALDLRRVLVWKSESVSEVLVTEMKSEMEFENLIAYGSVDLSAHRRAACRRYGPAHPDLTSFVHHGLFHYRAGAVRFSLSCSYWKAAEIGYAPSHRLRRARRASCIVMKSSVHRSKAAFSCSLASVQMNLGFWDSRFGTWRCRGFPAQTAAPRCLGEMLARALRCVLLP